MQLMDFVNSGAGTLNALLLARIYIDVITRSVGELGSNQRSRSRVSQSPQASLTGGKVQIAIINSCNHEIRREQEVSPCLPTNHTAKR
jgi:hypothetical protein